MRGARWSYGGTAAIWGYGGHIGGGGRWWYVGGHGDQTGGGHDDHVGARVPPPKFCHWYSYNMYNNSYHYICAHDLLIKSSTFLQIWGFKAGAPNYGKKWGGYNFDGLVVYCIAEQAKPAVCAANPLRPARGVRGYAHPRKFWKVGVFWSILTYISNK